MRSTRRCIYQPRFTTLLVLIVALHVSVFIVMNCCIIPSNNETGDNPPSFTFRRSGIAAVESKKEVKSYQGWDIRLKEDSNVDDDDDDSLSYGTRHPRNDLQVERSPSGNDHSNSYNSELDTISIRSRQEDATKHPNNIKQNQFQEQKKLVVNNGTSTFDQPVRDADMQAKKEFTERVAVPQVSSAFLENANRSVKQGTPSVAFNLNLQSREKRLTALDAGNSTTSHVNTFLTDRKNDSATQGNLSQLSVKTTDAKQVHLSNTISSLKGKAGTTLVEPLLPITTPPLTQEIVDSIAENLEIHFEVLEDFRQAVITLRNKGPTAIERNQWSIYVCITTGMELGNLVHKPQGYILPQEKSIKLTHLNGCSYKVEPTRDFKTILPGKSLEFKVHIGHTFAKSDLTPRWYIAAEGLEPRTISCTADEQLDFVLIPERRKPWDGFRNNDVPDLGKAPLLVIPTPSQIIGLNESKRLSIDGNWIVFGEPGLEEETSFLAGKLNIEKSMSQLTGRRVIKLKLGEVPLNQAKEQQSVEWSAESYHLEVNISHPVISITGAGNAGVFYGVQTLLALINDKGEVPQVSIKDSPRFSYRGLMIDVARNFQPKREILKLLDVMAKYKMNKLHFHLTDNEGWRLQIPGIEELTSVGSRRCHDLKEKSCIFSHLGSGPDTSTSGTGFYTTEDYREILRHAKKRHVQVIPEFDLPGHGHAAIKSMIARHDQLIQEGKENEAKEFLINDFKDESRYLSVQLFTDETANPCLNSTYRFMEQVLKELTNLHRDIQPLTVYHFGGDEVPGGAWRKSPECEKLAGTLNFPYKDIHAHSKLKEYFLKRLSNITAKFNLAIGGWGDFLFDKETRTLLPREFFSNKEVYSYAWSVTGAAKNLREVSLMANHGYKVVLSNPDYIYLDHPYEPHSEERGKYWATQYTDTRKIFGFMPEDLYKDIAPQELNCTGLKKCGGGRQNVLGVEAAIWGETIRTADHMYTMLFPRLLALAERAWHKASWEEVNDEKLRDRERSGDWVRFANTLGYRELGRLDKMDLPYRVPPPAARIIDKKLQTRVALPGLQVQYSSDGGVTWNDVRSEMEVDRRIKLKTRSADGKRVSREVEIEPPTPTPNKMTTESRNQKSKEQETPALIKPKESGSKSEVKGERSERNHSVLAQREDNSETRPEQTKNNNEKQIGFDPSTDNSEEPEVLNKPKPTNMKIENSSEMTSQSKSAATEKVKKDGETKPEETDNKHEEQKDLDRSSDVKEGLQVFNQPKPTNLKFNTDKELSIRKDFATAEKVKEDSETKHDETESKRKNNTELEPSSEGKQEVYVGVIINSKVTEIKAEMSKEKNSVLTEKVGNDNNSKQDELRTQT